MRATPVATVAVQGNVVYGVVAPVGTPDSAVVRLNSAVNKALASSADLKSALAKLGAEPRTSTPKEAAALIGTGR
jgi:tripartite-type tricarboxylate transporter receptor subunit TctC